MAGEFILYYNSQVQLDFQNSSGACCSSTRQPSGHCAHQVPITAPRHACPPLRRLTAPPAGSSSSPMPRSARRHHRLLRAGRALRATPGCPLSPAPAPAPNGAFLEAKLRVVFLPAPGAGPSVLGVRGVGRVKPPTTRPRQTPGSNPPAAVSAPAPGWTSPTGQRPGASLAPPRRAAGGAETRTEAGGLERRPAPASCRRGGGLRVSGGAGRVRPAQSPTRPTRLARDTRGTK